MSRFVRLGLIVESLAIGGAENGKITNRISEQALGADGRLLAQRPKQVEEGPLLRQGGSRAGSVRR